jgi:hypothetical protein
LLRQGCCKPRFDRGFLRVGVLKTNPPNIKPVLAYPDLSVGIGKVEVRVVGEDPSFFSRQEYKELMEWQNWRGL